jgi:uncharacterized protein Veg
LFKLHHLKYGDDKRHIDLTRVVAENETALNGFSVNGKTQVGRDRNWQILTQLIEAYSTVVVPNKVKETAHSFGRILCYFAVINFH